MWAFGKLLRTARWRERRAVWTMTAKLLLGYWGPSWAQGKNTAQKMCLRAHTCTRTFTLYIDTGPASKTCLQKSLNLNFLPCYRSIQTKTALFSHSCRSHAVNLFQVATNPVSTVPFWSYRCVLGKMYSKFLGYIRRFFLTLCLTIMVFLKKKKSTNYILHTCLAL